MGFERSCPTEAVPVCSGVSEVLEAFWANLAEHSGAECNAQCFGQYLNSLHGNIIQVVLVASSETADP
jgi:hypothetical protein